MPKRKCIDPRCGEITSNPAHLIEFSTPKQVGESATALTNKRMVFVDPLWEHYMKHHAFQVKKSLISLVTCPDSNVTITVRKNVRHQAHEAEVLFSLNDFKSIPKGGINYEFIKKLKEILSSGLPCHQQIPSFTSGFCFFVLGKT